MIKMTWSVCCRKSEVHVHIVSSQLKRGDCYRKCSISLVHLNQNILQDKNVSFNLLQQWHQVTTAYESLQMLPLEHAFQGEGIKARLIQC